MPGTVCRTRVEQVKHCMSNDPKEFQRTADFTEVCRLITEGETFFVTGRAGSGKSTMVVELAEEFRHHPMVVLAPTGRAALNVGGSTIHRFFQFSPNITPTKAANKKLYSDYQHELFKHLRTIIIDEASMLRADLLDCIASFLRRHGPSRNERFGGMQLVFVGDLYQLPPVVTNDESEMFTEHYTTPYFFSAHALTGHTLPIVELESNYRQADPAFTELLDRVRLGHVSGDVLDEINQQVDPDRDRTGDDVDIVLATTNRKVQSINTSKLQELAGPELLTTATVKGNFPEKLHPTLATLRFKVGARVMMLNNHGGIWVNGSMGTIASADCSSKKNPDVEVQLGDSQPLEKVPWHSWEMIQYTVDDGEIATEVVGKFTQLPFCLAWAVTIHKGQGATYDSVLIDLGWGTFANGQAYVALSRCRSLQGITLTAPIKQEWIQVDSKISRFLESGLCQ